MKNIWRISSVLDVPISVLFSPFQNAQYRAIVFDLHYTILRLSPSRGTVYQKIFKKHGFNAHPREIKKAFSAVWKDYGDDKVSEDSKNHHSERNIEEWWSGFHFKMLKKLGLRNKTVAEVINRDISHQFYGNPIEPLKEWILFAHHAEKLASSNDFDEIKSFAEKIGTNRRLLARNVIFDFVRPFDLIPKYAKKCERSRATGAASEQTNSSQNPSSFVWSQLLNAVRTYFTKN